MVVYQNQWARLARGQWWGDGGAWWGYWVSGMLFIKTIRNFLSCFSNLVSGSPLTYHSELIDEDQR